MKRKKTYPRVLGTLLGLLLTSHAGANSLDPISADEISRVMLFAPAASGNLQGRAARPSNDAADSNTAQSTDQQREFLGVKAHRFEKSEQNNGHRWADTLVYDYQTDELITTVFNLDTNSIISVQRNREMQPPLSDNELERAIGLVFADEEERGILAAEYKKITGGVLSNKQQLHYKAFTFFADSMPNVVNEASKPCGIQRCAQILIYTADKISFHYSPILNLSAGVITQRIGF